MTIFLDTDIINGNWMEVVDWLTRGLVNPPKRLI